MAECTTSRVQKLLIVSLFGTLHSYMCTRIHTCKIDALIYTYPSVHVNVHVINSLLYVCFPLSMGTQLIFSSLFLQFQREKEKKVLQSI